MSPTKKSTSKAPAKQAAKAPAKKAPAKKAPAKPKAEAEAPAATPPPAAAPAEPAPQVELVDMARLAQELRQPLLQVRKMVQTGQIPGVKVEGEWRFNLQLVREAMLRRSRGF
jgi:hypothetical protein